MEGVIPIVFVTVGVDVICKVDVGVIDVVGVTVGVGEGVDVGVGVIVVSKLDFGSTTNLYFPEELILSTLISS